MNGKGRVGVKSDGTAPPCGFRVEGTARKVISKVGVAVGTPRHFVRSSASGLRAVAVKRGAACNGV